MNLLRLIASARRYYSWCTYCRVEFERPGPHEPWTQEELNKHRCPKCYLPDRLIPSDK